MLFTTIPVYREYSSLEVEDYVVVQKVGADVVVAETPA
jgi:hypothetical protein